MGVRLPCIWCLQHRTKSREHIVPEVLGCPRELILNRGEVCKVCNHGRLSVLDGVLAESFDFMRMQAGQRGKKGRRPRITGRTNLRGGPGDQGEPEYHINFEPHAVQTRKYGTIPPRSGGHRDVDGSFENVGEFVRIQMKLTVGGHPDFSRAIHKIAFERLVQLRSWEFAVDRRFDPLREYVLNGKGHREVLGLVPHEWAYRHEFPGRLFEDESGYPSVDFTLCGLPFWVYLGPNQGAVERVKQMMFQVMGKQGWVFLPVPDQTDNDVG